MWNERVRAHVRGTGLSLAEIARRAQIPERRFRRLMNNRTHLRPADFHGLSVALGKRIDVLFEAPRGAA